MWEAVLASLGKLLGKAPSAIKDIQDIKKTHIETKLAEEELQAKTSRIVEPTAEEIRAYDPKREKLDEAICHDGGVSYGPAGGAPPLLSGGELILLLIVAAAIVGGLLIYFFYW